MSSVSRYNIKGHQEDLPSLKTPRLGHGCSSFMKNGERASLLQSAQLSSSHLNLQVLVVAGGMTAEGYTASTEIYEGGEWREVGNLPVPMSDLRGVTLDGTVIMTGKTYLTRTINTNILCMQVERMVTVLTPTFSHTVLTRRSGHRSGT